MSRSKLRTIKEHLTIEVSDFAILMSPAPTEVVSMVVGGSSVPRRIQELVVTAEIAGVPTTASPAVVP